MNMVILYGTIFIRLYKVVLTFESEDEILKCDHSNERIEQYFPVVLYKVVLTFEFLIYGLS